MFRSTSLSEANQCAIANAWDWDNTTANTAYLNGTQSGFDIDSCPEVVPPTFILSKTTASVNESGTTETFSVVLTTQPTDDVGFYIASNNIDEATVDLAVLTFTNANWSTAQTVIISGVDDSNIDGNQNSTITIRVSSNSDSAFNTLESKNCNCNYS